MWKLRRHKKSSSSGWLLSLYIVRCEHEEKKYSLKSEWNEEYRLELHIRLGLNESNKKRKTTYPTEHNPIDDWLFLITDSKKKSKKIW